MWSRMSWVQVPSFAPLKNILMTTPDQTAPETTPDGELSEVSQELDFRPRLRAALKNAVPHTPDDPLKNESALAGLEGAKELPDDYVIFDLFHPKSNDVVTTNPGTYLALLMQAHGVLEEDSTGQFADLSNETRAWLEAANEHELAHGVAAKLYGNSHTISFFGVEFMIDPAGKLMFWPFYAVYGPLKKVHRAAVTAAPSDMSDIDQIVVSRLGYNNIEELKAVAEVTPPVDEHEDLRAHLIRNVISVPIVTD